MSKIYKGLVKRLLSQLEIDIELDKATQLCNAFHAELSQGKPENKVIVDYDEKLKSFYINDNQPSLDKRYKAMLDASPPINTEDI